ncbi:MAG: HD-GYP domain-containing protein [Clostridia bacterium]|jgi:putative nucleotidyltransferase with HDIG domain|nr:HD-GYP domain-containing protein [Clostridia bacterium]
MKYSSNKPLGSQHFHDIIDCLVAALEARDIYTSGHSTRVADMSYDIARLLGLKGPQLEYVHMAAHLHDIGKLGIPETVLNKAGKLSDFEWEQVRMHPEIGFRILSKSQELKSIAKIVLHHHERWDGQGYPQGLKGTDIPLGSRIIAVADSIDAMNSERPYRQALSWGACLKEIEANKGSMYDPDVVNEFLQAVK